MKIVAKVMDNGKHIGYLVDDDGLREFFRKQLLYSRNHFHEFLDAGYKFHSYDPDTIEDPTGKPIVELPEEQADDEMRDWYEMQQEQVITDCYPDSYCAKYYTFQQKMTIEFKKSLSYEINTRQELESYLDAQHEFFEKNLYVPDVRPLNSFVNPEALYSLDEICTKPEVQYYFQVILNRHKLRNYVTYSKLVNWLQEQGVLNTGNPTPFEFLQAYNAWGVDGIKDSCTDMKIKQNVDIAFNRADEDVLESAVLDNRVCEPILVDNQQYLYYGKIKEDISEIIEFKREPIVTPTSGDLLLLKRANPIGFKYIVKEGWISNPSDRMYYRFFSDDGYVYNVKISVDDFAVFSGKVPSILEKNFALNSVRSGFRYSLLDCLTSQDYYINNCLMIKAMSVSKNRIKTPPFKSNFDMLVSDGVSVPAAVISVCLDAYNNAKSHESNARILDPKGKQLLTLDAYSMYNSKIPTSVIEALELNSDDLTVKDLLDVINSRDEIDTNTEFELNGVPLNLSEYCAKLSFVERVLDGEITINSLGDGIIMDEIASVDKIYSLLRTSAYAVCGTDASKEEILTFIDTFENQECFDMDKYFPYCDNAYKGCLRDFVNQRRARGEAGQWLYCTAIFRELSNAPIDEQRDYAMEVVTVPSFEKPAAGLRAMLTKAVEEADLSGVPEELHEYIITEAPFIAANLFFHILGDHVGNNFKTPTGDYLVPLSTGIGSYKAKVAISKYLFDSVQAYDINGHRRIIPLNSYVQCEKFEHTTGFSWMITNVEVTPWRVHPKKGYKINKLNFALNYLVPSAFDKFSENFKNNLMECNGKRYTLWNTKNEGFLLKWSELDPMPNPDNETIETITQYLDNRMTEDIHLYYKRWCLFHKKAKQDGEVLKTMQLRSDVVFANFAEIYGEEPITANVYDSPENLKANGYLTLMQPTIDDQYNVKMITTKDVSRVKRFSWFDYDYVETKRWDRILNNNVEVSAMYYITGSIIMLISADGKSTPINGRFLSVNALNDLASKNVCYQLDATTFFFKAINGDFIVEVIND